MTPLLQIYQSLFDYYGPQGWWPIHQEGYHHLNYRIPRNSKERLEICFGAILTQNTNWKNVEKAILNMFKLNLFDTDTFDKISLKNLESAIKPSGYFVQKAKKLKAFFDYYKTLNECNLPTREGLLAIWGIGPETADSILLYAYQTPQFVVDSYTKRLLTNLNMISEKSNYQQIKQLFETQIPSNVPLYQEFHALLVAHGKNFYSKKPYGGCFLEIHQQDFPQ